MWPGGLVTYDSNYILYLCLQARKKQRDYVQLHPFYIQSRFRDH